MSQDAAITCPGCGADLREFSQASVALKTLQENPRVIYVRVSVAEDCCPACRQVEGAYAKETAPHLPVEGCSQNHGCRCFYQPVLEVIYP
jgi:hypothetical protein